MNADNRIFFLLILLLGVLHFSETSAQKTKNQLKQERHRNLKKIKQTERILRETKKQKKTSLGELNALTQRIKQQETLTRSIQNEINLLNVDINENTQIIKDLEQDLSLLKQEYATMLFSAQKARGKIGKLMLLFAAESFNQLLMRLKYMEQYSTARQNQAKVIVRIQGVIADQVAQTQQVKKEKNALLQSQVTESNSLVELRQKQQVLIKKLENEEQRFKAELKKTQQAIAQLDKLISNIIRLEMERAAKKRRATKNPEEIALSTNFEKNKSKFPLPVAGFISQRFGTQKHPFLKRIEIHNDGINIQTRQNEKVKAIFKGEVRAIAFIPSIGNSIVIGHGEYFTVYSGLKEVAVKRGQQVETNQNIGSVLTNAEGISELRFQIRKNTVAMDPELWLRN